MIDWNSLPPHLQRVLQETLEAEKENALESQRPSVLFRPELIRTGTGWIAKYGDLEAEGITPEVALHTFDEAFRMDEGEIIVGR